MLYALPVVPCVTVAEPVIAPGAPGVVIGVTANVAAVLVPHPFVAVTVTLPAVPFGVADKLAVVEVPAHPVGLVHV